MAEIKVEVKNEGDFGNQEVIGWLDGNAEITMSDSALGPDQKWMWRVTSSRTVPTSLECARRYGELIMRVTNKAKRLDNYYRSRRDLIDKHLYNVVNDCVYILEKITTDTEDLIYNFKTVPIIGSFEHNEFISGLEIDDFIKETLEITEDEYKAILKKNITDKIGDLNEKLLSL